MISDNSILGVIWEWMSLHILEASPYCLSSWPCPWSLWGLCSAQDMINFGYIPYILEKNVCPAVRGYSVVCLLIGCHFNSHFQTVYSLTELLLFLSITGWGRWTTSHYNYNYNLANFSLYICHLLPYVFWSISFIKIKVIVFPWWSDHPPLSLLQSLSFMSACLWCLCLKGTSFLWVSFTGHRFFHLFHFDFCIFIIKVCHKQYIVSFLKKIQSDNLYLLIGTFSTFTYNYWYFGL